jgi:hypothetical protein
MPQIFYTANQYIGQYSHINTANEQSVTCRKIDIYRAIITVGTPSFLTWKDINQQGLFRALSNSIIQKVLLVQANIDSSPNGMKLHPSFHQQVSDLKRVVSYNLGMAFAKIYAEKLLEIPNLIHVETLKKSDVITFHNTAGKRREPDLVGLTADGSWHVFEAKGVSTNQLKRKIKDAKEQASEVDTIHGTPPSTLSACATYFGTQKIISRIEDPESKRRKKLEIKRQEYLKTYYNPFFALKSGLMSQPKKSRFHDINYFGHDIVTNKLRLSICLDEEVYELIQEKNFDLINESLLEKRRKHKGISPEERDNYSVGLDGFLVKYTHF